MLTMGRKERNNERPRGMFYRGPTVGTKYTYQNLELTHMRVDMAKVGSYTLHVRLRVTFVRKTRGGDLQNKGH